jgi:hypothetical protein
VADCVLIGRFSSPRQDKITPLYISAAAQQAGAVRALIEAKAELDFECSPGKTAEVLAIPHTRKTGLSYFGACFCQWEDRVVWALGFAYQQ